MNSADDDDVISNDGWTLDVFRRAVRELPRFCATVDHGVPSRPYVDKEGSYINVWPAR